MFLSLSFSHRFFRKNPYFQDLFPNLKNLKGEQDMLHSAAFEIQAMAILGVYDDVILNLDKDLETTITKLEDVAKLHTKLDDFDGDFFQVCQ